LDILERGPGTEGVGIHWEIDPISRKIKTRATGFGKSKNSIWVIVVDGRIAHTITIPNE